MTQWAHKPVLLNEVLAIFDGQSIRTFVDGTLGLGGHAEALLTAHPEIQCYVGLDQDANALAIAKERLSRWAHKTQFHRINFSALDTIEVENVDGILLDIGVSSLQLDTPERGFSFRLEGPLDMRMDARNPLTASIIVNEWPEGQLARIFRDYGEEKKWRAAARKIAEARKKGPIHTTRELAELLQPLFPPWKKGINPLTLIFQGLRIAVNKELEVLEQTLPKAIDLLDPEGRLAVITFHSLEDRIVKQTFQHFASDKLSTSGMSGLFLDKEPTVKILSRKPVGPTDEEAMENPRSRSAKLRAIEKLIGH